MGINTRWPHCSCKAPCHQCGSPHRQKNVLQVLLRPFQTKSRCPPWRNSWRPISSDGCLHELRGKGWETVWHAISHLEGRPRRRENTLHLTRPTSTRTPPSCSDLRTNIIYIYIIKIRVKYVWHLICVCCVHTFLGQWMWWWCWSKNTILISIHLYLFILWIQIYNNWNNLDTF